MEEIEFNLWDEPWILVKTNTGLTKEVSLEEVLLQAQNFTSLAGELPTQDFAIMRLLLAILHTALFRFTPEEPEEEWAALWNEGCFPKDKILDYERKWKDRFFLFHPEHPFYQIVDVGELKNNPIEKLIGDLSESKNKKRFFVLRSGNEKSSLSYAEAARWLIHNNAYDCCSLQIPVFPSISFLGQICSLFAKGSTLFRSLMLNMVLLRDGTSKWEENSPCWEKDDKPIPSCTDKKALRIRMPDNPAELYTNQFRYVKLIRENNRVIRYRARAGKWFEKKNAFNEQMTYWKGLEDKTGYEPYPYDKPKQIWREYSSIVASSTDESHNSGLIQWLASIRDVLGTNFLATIETLGVKYGSMNSQIDNVIYDTIDVHLDILTNIGADWRDLIRREIEICEEFASIIGDLTADLKKAAGIKETDSAKDSAKEHFYYAVDIPFRRWLLSLDSENFDNSYEAKRKELRETMINIAKDQGEKLYLNAGRLAFIGHETQDKNGKVIGFISAPKSYNIFMRKIDEKKI